MRDQKSIFLWVFWFGNRGVFLDTDKQQGAKKNFRSIATDYPIKMRFDAFVRENILSQEANEVYRDCSICFTRLKLVLQPIKRVVMNFIFVPWFEIYNRRQF